MTLEEIEEVIEAFAHAIRRAREAELDGVELHGAHGYLQFFSLSSDEHKEGSIRRLSRKPLPHRPRDCRARAQRGWP